MVKCKKCGSEIKELVNVVSGYCIYKFLLADNAPFYEADAFEADNNINDFRCPECDAVLAHGEEEAIKALKQKK